MKLNDVSKSQAVVYTVQAVYLKNWCKLEKRCHYASRTEVKRTAGKPTMGNKVALSFNAIASGVLEQHNTKLGVPLGSVVTVNA